jgi:hypothetical protein
LSPHVTLDPNRRREDGTRTAPDNQPNRARSSHPGISESQSVKHRGCRHQPRVAPRRLRRLAVNCELLSGWSVHRALASAGLLTLEIELVLGPGGPMSALPPGFTSSREIW